MAVKSEKKKGSKKQNQSQRDKIREKNRKKENKKRNKRKVSFNGKEKRVSNLGSDAYLVLFWCNYDLFCVEYDLCEFRKV